MMAGFAPLERTIHEARPDDLGAGFHIIHTPLAQQ